MNLLGLESVVNHHHRLYKWFTLDRFANRVVSPLSCICKYHYVTNSVFTLSAPCNMPPNRSVTLCILCVCVASLSMYPISHTHSGTARCATVYSRPITRLSVKRLEFIRDTESRWQLPTDLTCVYKRRWSDPRGGYHQVNKDIVSLERSIKKWAKNTQRSIKTACGMLSLYREASGGELNRKQWFPVSAAGCYELIKYWHINWA